MDPWKTNKKSENALKNEGGKMHAFSLARGGATPREELVRYFSEGFIWEELKPNEATASFVEKNSAPC